MNRSSSTLSRQAAVVDRTTLRRNSGRPWNWPKTPEELRDGAFVVKTTALAAAGATALAVEALKKALPVGTLLKFGTWAPVTVTLNDASVSAGDTSVTVQALTGPIPAGFVLDFSGGTNAQLAKLSAAASTGDTTLTVEKLDGTIANTQTALFPGGTIAAILTAPAVEGATSLTVDELQFAVADEAEAIVPGEGSKSIKALTIVAETADGSLIRRADATNETAIGFIETAASEGDISATGYAVLTGGALYENLLPDAVEGDLPGGWKTELANAGCHFNYEDYGDNTVTP